MLSSLQHQLLGWNLLIYDKEWKFRRKAPDMQKRVISHQSGRPGPSYQQLQPVSLLGNPPILFGLAHWDAHACNKNISIRKLIDCSNMCQCLYNKRVIFRGNAICPRNQSEHIHSHKFMAFNKIGFSKFSKPKNWDKGEITNTQDYTNCDIRIVICLDSQICRDDHTHQ